MPRANNLRSNVRRIRDDQIELLPTPFRHKQLKRTVSPRLSEDYFKEIELLKMQLRVWKCMPQTMLRLSQGFQVRVEAVDDWFDPPIAQFRQETEEKFTVASRRVKNANLRCV